MPSNRSTARDVAAVIAGLAAGVLGSRLLPPLLANANGSKRARQGHNPFELLIEDHRQILTLVNDLAGQSAETPTARRASSFMMLKRKLAKHAMAEEDVVYPLLHTQDGHTQSSKELYDDHADIKILLFRMEELLKQGADWSQPVRSLQELLERHIEEEELVTFPTLRQKLDDERLPAVSGQIRREEAMVL
jgi:iron-sulfur cluster repair protein YtfE (RIC family)